ncbi:hypothetical protein MCC02041_16360 [Faecalibacterium prausnitzii]|nr:hypothetical protein MCC02041_16360 [Faecalibacterium prausnitzii]
MYSPCQWILAGAAMLSHLTALRCSACSSFGSYLRSAPAPSYAHLYPNKQQELVSKLEAIGSPTSNNDDSDLMSLG